MKFLDLFAGIGGFRRGMELAGHECVGFCECDKFATASYISMHCITEEQREYLATLDFKQRQKEILKEEYRNGEWYADDIKNIDSRTIPRADCWCFGFPCQDISIAGNRLGFAGNRSSLFFGTTKLIGELEKEHRPKYLFIENVKNLLSVNGGFDFARMFVELDELGYDAEWQILNSKDFGVPQNRERVFIIGHLRGTCGPAVFPLETSNGQNSVYQIGQQESHRDNPNQYRVYDTDGISPTLNKMDGGGREPNVPMFCDLRYGSGLNVSDTSRSIQARQYKGCSTNYGECSGVAMFCDMNEGGLYTTKEARTISARYDKGVGNRMGENSGVAIPILTPEKENKRQNGRRCKKNGEDMFTLTSQDRHGVGISVEPIGGANWHVSERFQKDIMDDVSRTVTADQNNAVALELKGIRGGLQEHQQEREDSNSPALTSAMGEGGGQIPVMSFEVKENSDQDSIEQNNSVEPIGGVCTDMSLEFQTDIMDGMSRTLKVDNHDASVALKVNEDTKTEEGIWIQIEEDLEVYAVWSEKYNCYIAIRKLTPRECFRLQGFDDYLFDRAQFVNSDTQLYKQSGNSVSVPVIEAIAKKMPI